MARDQQTQQQHVTAYARLAMMMGGTFVFITAVTLLLLASGKGRGDIDTAVFALGVCSGLAGLAGWAMIAAWGFFSRGGTAARTAALLYSAIAGVAALTLSGLGIMLNITGQGPALATLILGVQTLWAFCAVFTGAGVRADLGSATP